MTDGEPRHVHDELALSQALELAGVHVEIEDSRGRRLALLKPPPGGPSEARVAKTFDCVVGDAPFRLSLSFNDAQGLARERELIRQAFFDAQTGLPNRALAERSIDALIAERPAPFAFLLLDLDHFARLRREYGGADAKTALQRVATRLVAAAGGGGDDNMVARLGRNSFAVLMTDSEDRPRLLLRIEAILARLREPIPIDGRELYVSATAGVALFPDDGQNFELLRAHAEHAVHIARAGGEGRIGFYDPALDADPSQRGRDEQLLRAIVRDRAIRCAYQPKVNMRTGEIVGVEALMRWSDAHGNPRAPGHLLQLASDLGLMEELTYIVVDEVARQIDRINDAFGQDCLVSVNVGAKQAGDTQFMSALVEHIHATGFAGRVVLELTEEAFIQKREFQERILPMIRAIGARVSIDDFGIGYSSLSALAEISADELKIDRSFITDVHKRPRSQNILRAIEALGHSLGMSIIVEGVETQEELDYLRTRTRIDYAQGHYFARPMILDDDDAAATPREQRMAPPARETGPSRAANGRTA